MNTIDRYGMLIGLVDKYMREQDYAPVPGRFDQYLKIVKFFSALTEQQDGFLDQDSIMPHNTHGYITVQFSKLVLKGKVYQSFISIIQACSAFEIISRADGSFEISMTFPHIFQIKKNPI